MTHLISCAFNMDTACVEVVVATDLTVVNTVSEGDVGHSGDGADSADKSTGNAFIRFHPHSSPCAACTYRLL